MVGWMLIFRFIYRTLCFFFPVFLVVFLLPVQKKRFCTAQSPGPSSPSPPGLQDAAPLRPGALRCRDHRVAAGRSVGAWDWVWVRWGV